MRHNKLKLMQLLLILTAIGVIAFLVIGFVCYHLPHFNGAYVIEEYEYYLDEYSLDEKYDSPIEKKLDVYIVARRFLKDNNTDFHGWMMYYDIKYDEEAEAWLVWIKKYSILHRCWSNHDYHMIVSNNGQILAYWEGR